MAKRPESISSEMLSSGTWRAASVTSTRSRKLGARCRATATASSTDASTGGEPSLLRDVVNVIQSTLGRSACLHGRLDYPLLFFGQEMPVVTRLRERRQTLDDELPGI